MVDIIDLLRDKLNNKTEKFSHICLISTEKLSKMHKINKLTVVGLSSSKSRYNTKYISTHAEIRAIQNLKHKLGKFKIKNINVNILVLRFSNDGKFNNSAPCHHCCIELEKYKNNGINIKNLYYSENNLSIRKLKFDDYLLENKYITKGWKNLRL